MAYQHIRIPTSGEKISVKDGKLNVPDQPIVGFVEGDGIGPDITKASLRVWDAAVEEAYGGQRKIHWCEIYLGEKAAELYDGNYFPDETLEAIKELVVAIKGPLTTPVGGGFRSLNVALRQDLDLYACVRPVRYYPGVPSPIDVYKRQPPLRRMSGFRRIPDAPARPRGAVSAGSAAAPPSPLSDTILHSYPPDHDRDWADFNAPQHAVAFYVKTDITRCFLALSLIHI